jgi:DHA1 family bicyclomycin/chloramphenicol resistance-like MFS transporter
VLDERVVVTPAAASSPAAPAQPVLGARGLIVFLAVLSAFPPISTDVYLPSLPTMAAYFGVPDYLANLTLIDFFLFFAAATLFWGPMSDRYGRRPVLLAGACIYAIASFGCAASQDVYQLIIFRAFQAIGGGAASAVSTAIVKDVYQGRRREVVLAVIQSLFVIAPTVAPMLGAGLLMFTSWRGVFVAQAVVGVAVLAGSLAFVETIEQRSSAGFGRTMGRLAVVLQNRGFTILLLIFCSPSLASLAFIGSSSYIYQVEFGLSSVAFSLLFAFNAFGMLVGPLLYVWLARRFSRLAVVRGCFAALAVAGLLIVALGRTGPLVFAALLLPATIATSCTRPPGVFLMLEQQQTDAGSASALMGSASMIMGSAGIAIASLSPGSLVATIGALDLAIGLVCGASWLIASRDPRYDSARGRSI